MSKKVQPRISFNNKKKCSEAETQILVRKLIDLKSKMYCFTDRPLRVLVAIKTEMIYSNSTYSIQQHRLWFLGV
jgi:hypothetical protein